MIVTDEQALAYDVQSYITQQALAALKLSPRNMLSLFHETGAKGEVGVVVSLTGTGTRAGVAQALRLSSGASGNAALGVTIASSGPSPEVVKAGAAKKFWLAGRFSLGGTTHVSGDLVGVTLFDNVGVTSMIIGVRGASSTANFVAYGTAGTFINSGIPFDTNKHIHRVWRDGATTYYQIDDNPPVSGDARPNVDSSPGAIALSAAADRTVDINWLHCATELE